MSRLEKNIPSLFFRELLKSPTVSLSTSRWRDILSNLAEIFMHIAVLYGTAFFLSDYVCLSRVRF